MNKIIYFLIIILLFFNISHSIAGSFYILVSADDGIETVDDIYNEFNINNTEQTLITIFNDYPPSSLNYLLINRPSTPPNPDSTTGMLYRYLFADYPYPMDVTMVNEFLQSSPLIEQVSYEGNLNPIIINPDSPVAGDDVSIEIALIPEICPDIMGISTDPLGNATDVHIAGNQITLDASIYIRPPTQPTGCNGERPYTRFELGQLQAGTYQINVNYVDDSITFPADDSQRSFALETSLTVQRGTPISVPTINNKALMLLGLLLLVYASLVIKRH